VIDKLPVQYMDALKPIDCEWTAGQISKVDVDSRFAELLDFKNTRGTLLFYGDNQKNSPSWHIGVSMQKTRPSKC
jgi:hypothetical protein